MNTVTRNGGRKGFSLMEAMFGMGVVGVVCTSLYAGMTFGIGLVRSASEYERATQILTEKLDTIRLYSWDKITTPGYIPTNFTKLYGPTNGMVFTGSVSITAAPVSSVYSTNMRQVAVSLSWTSGYIPRQRSVVSLVAKDGMQNYVY